MDIRQFFTSRAEAGSNGVQDNATDTVTGSLGPTSPETFTEVTTSSETNDLTQLTDSSSRSSCITSTRGVSTSSSSSTSLSARPTDLQCPVDTQHKLAIIRKGPHQPRDCEFPKQRFSNGNLSFNQSWYDLPFASNWLEYSPLTNRMYCFSCRLFDVNTNEPKWSHHGIHNWKKALEKIKKHQQSKHHINAESSRIQFLQSNRHIDVMVDRSRQEELCRLEQERIKNRQYLSRLIDVAKTLAKCGNPFRGHDESEESHNRGNFIEMVSLLSRWDHDLADYMKELKRNATCLSNRTQNDIIHAMAIVVKKQIVGEIITASFFSTMMDETRDVSGKEQVSIIIRFVDSNDIIQERLLSFCATPKTDAASLFSLLQTSVTTEGLKLENVIGQCYDGASNVRGEYNGVQAKVKEISPIALYVHCYAHRLNLVLVTAMTRNVIARNYFGTLEALYCFVRNSNYRHHLFQALQQDDFQNIESSDTHRPLSLKRLSDTRWACRYEAVRAVNENYAVLLELLEQVTVDSNNAKAVADAQGLLYQLRSFRFILCSVILKDLLQQTHVISKYLQGEGIDLNAAVTAIRATIDILKSKRNEADFKSYFDVAKGVSERNDIEVLIDDGRRRKRVSTHIDDNVNSQHHFQAIEDQLRVEFYYESLDCLLEQMEERFSQSTQEILLSFNCLSPQALLDKKSCPDSELSHLSSYYKLASKDALLSEYELFRQARRDLLENSDCKTILHVFQIFRVSGLRDVCPCLHQLYRLFLTLPITSASCERSFSKLTIVKNKLRSTTLQQRLEDLMILFVENDLTDKLELDTVIDTYDAMSSRRIKL